MLVVIESRMPPLQQLLGKEDKFFTLLESSALEARNSAQALLRFIQSQEKARSLDEFVIARRNDKTLTAQIREELCTNFVTSLEREDIDRLSHTLYKIPKTAEKIAERIMLAPHLVGGVDLTRQVQLFERAAESLLSMIKGARKQADWDRTKALNEELQTIEGDADKLMLELLRAIYSDREAIRVVFLKDIVELLEGAIDRCRDAGSIVSLMVLKNA